MGWLVILGGSAWAIWSMTSQFIGNAQIKRRLETEAQIKAALERDRQTR